MLGSAHAMTSTTPSKFAAIAFGGFGAVLLAVVVGALLGDAIPHEHQGRLDPFADRFIFGSVFVAGLVLGVWRRLRLRELWVSVAITQVVVFHIVAAYTGFLDISGWWLLYGSRLVVLPFILALLVLYVLSFTRRTA